MPIVRIADREFDVDVVVFDKDGTLIDLDASWAPLAESWIEAVAAADTELSQDLADTLGYDFTAGRLVPDGTIAQGTLGDVGDATHRRLVAMGRSDEAAAASVSRARVAIEVAPANSAVTLADLEPLFTRLTSGRLKLAVLTSDDRVATLDLLEQHGVARLVSAVVTADDVDHPKPHPDGLQRIGRALGVVTERILMVGDSRADHEAARAAGSWFVAVGPSSSAAVGADASVVCVDEIHVD
jgi:phosphoglycolate phosphatase